MNDIGTTSVCFLAVDVDDPNATASSTIHTDVVDPASLQRELAAGTPIDGAGFQMHLRSGFNDFSGVENHLQRFADPGLDIYITEFDVALDAPDTEKTQADVYVRVLEICLAQPRCKAVPASWLIPDGYACL